MSQNSVQFVKSGLVVATRAVGLQKCCFFFLYSFPGLLFILLILAPIIINLKPVSSRLHFLLQILSTTLK